mmetsp:Transcript_6751/g.18839  ORF Transcript_6751/g.18839 Transcript_6751/m.18839 type:complete len:254 (-) Transcript_6751:141-902(-)
MPSDPLQGWRQLRMRRNLLQGLGHAGVLVGPNPKGPPLLVLEHRDGILIGELGIPAQYELAQLDGRLGRQQIGIHRRSVDHHVVDAVVPGVVGLDEKVGHVARGHVGGVAPTIVVGNLRRLSLLGPLHTSQILGEVVVVYVASADGCDECCKQDGQGCIDECRPKHSEEEGKDDGVAWRDRRLCCNTIHCGRGGRTTCAAVCLARRTICSCCTVSMLSIATSTSGGGSVRSLVAGEHLLIICRRHYFLMQRAS